VDKREFDFDRVFAAVSGGVQFHTVDLFSDAMAQFYIRLEGRLIADEPLVMGRDGPVDTGGSMFGADQQQRLREMDGVPDRCRNRSRESKAGMGNHNRPRLTLWLGTGSSVRAFNVLGDRFDSFFIGCGIK